VIFPPRPFCRGLRPTTPEYRRRADEQARVLEAERQAKAAAAAALQAEIDAAGITVEGLIELIDVCDRLPAAPIKGKLAEIEFGGRNLRVFETSDPAVLMVLERRRRPAATTASSAMRGLVADLRLFARATEPS